VNFQNITAYQLGQGAVTTSYTTLYTVPANTRTFFKQIDFCNTTATPVYVYMSVVPSGGTAGTSNSIFYNTAIPAYSTLQWCGTQVMNEGGTIQIKASALGVTATASGGQAV
jgi:hypothetical protein